jgi:hypothetical protein
MGERQRGGERPRNVFQIDPDSSIIPTCVVSRIESRQLDLSPAKTDRTEFGGGGLAFAVSDLSKSTGEDLVDHFVKLDRLPDGFEIPPQMKDRMHFDGEAHKLVFRGYMSKAEFDRLSELTRDWTFRRTLEELFRQCIPEQQKAPHGLRRLLLAVSQFFSRG